MAYQNPVKTLPVSFQIATWNVNGLKEGTKKQKVLHHLGKLSSDIVFLQELHFKAGQIEYLKRQWVGEAFEAVFTSRSRGVGILINKRIPFKLISQHPDIHGRFLIVKCEMFGESYTLINVYNPPNSDMSFLGKIQTIIDRSPTGVIIMGSDLNNIFSSNDSSTKTRKINPPKRLTKFISDNELQDVWRTLHPNTIDYTYFSHPQNSYSRLDYLFISQTDLDRVISSKINNIIISDHAVVSCVMSPIQNTLSQRIWRMNRKYLTDNEFLEHIKNHIEIFIQTNIEVADPEDKPEIGVIWDAFKAYIRGVMIGFASKKKKEYEKELNQVKEHIRNLEEKHKKQMDRKTLSEMQVAKLKLDNLLTKKANDFRHNSNRLNYISVNKSGKHLASLVKKVLKRQPIALKNKTSGLVNRNNQLINKEFKTFYENLYTSETQNQDPLPLLNSLNLKSLSAEQKELLNKDFSCEEIKSAIKESPPKKAPGMDGLSIEFYSTFWSSINNLFMEVINSAQIKHTLPQTMYLATISVLPKPGRECESPSDFRPISLINCDKKIITKVMNNRLAQILPSIIHHNQSGFIKNRDLKTNTRTCLSLIQHAKQHNKELTLMAVDAEKAFDRLEWSYLYKVLEVYDFPIKFINMIKTIYKAPKAQVYTNGILSDPFPLSRGTAQGCPLSPSLFALAIEPLAQKIRQTEQIKGISIGKKQYKLSLFADDLLLYLNNVNESMPHLLEIMKTFSQLSGYKINEGKTELLVINKGASDLEEFRQFKLKKTNIKYLGCYMSANKLQLYKDNFTPLIKGLKEDFERWSDLNINLIGRINLFKMMWLPKFLYIFQTISITPPKTFFKEVNSLITSFIWSKKSNRVKRKLLQYPREEGGLNLPNMELYHNTSQMFYIYKIINSINEEPWIDIENHQLQPNSLLLALFPKKRIKTSNFVINSTVNAWKNMKKILGQDIGIPKHIQIWNNPSIRIQNVPLNWEAWINSGIQKLSDIINNNCLMSFQELKDKYKLNDREIFKYLQLKNWVIENLDLGEKMPTKLCDMVKKRDKMRPLIGAVYNTLIDAEDNEEMLKNIYNKWNNDLGIEDAKYKWKGCLQRTYKTTTNENLRLIQYKLMTRMYYTRDKINKFDPTSSDRCLKCCTQKDSLIHAFWQCEKVRKTWEKIERILSINCNCTVEFTPMICLFQNTEAIRQPIDRQILFSSLVYKKLLLQYWKNKEAPSVQDWKSLMKYYLSIERTMAEDSNKIEQFNELWSKLYEAL